MNRLYCLLYSHPCSRPPETVATSILSSSLEAIGNTPMIRLNKIAKSEGLECELCK